jgi:hypothetical protein
MPPLHGLFEKIPHPQTAWSWELALMAAIIEFSAASALLSALRCHFLFFWYRADGTVMTCLSNGSSTDHLGAAVKTQMGKPILAAASSQASNFQQLNLALKYSNCFAFLLPFVRVHFTIRLVNCSKKGFSLSIHIRIQLLHFIISHRIEQVVNGRQERIPPNQLQCTL